MAFENVFGNIDWQAQNRAARQDQAMLMDAISRGIGAYERGQDRDMRQRQLDMRQQELDARLAQTKPVDYEQAGMDALAKQKMGIPLTSQDEAALYVMEQVSRDQVFSDPVTGQLVVRPSRWRNIGMGGTPAPQTQAMPMQQPTPATPPMIPPVSAEMVGGMPMEAVPQQPMDQIPAPKTDFKVTGMLAGTPKGEFMEQEARLKGKIKQLESDIQFRKEQMKSQKGRERVTGTIETTMSDLERLNDELLAKQAVISNDAGVLQNLGAKYGSSWLGRQTQSVTRPEIESLRQEYITKRDSLIPAYIAYNELPATVVDTEEFQQRILQSFGDPTLNYETNKAALDNMKMQFGLSGNGGAKTGNTFASEADALAANLPAGTEIIINGRRAVIE